MKKSSISEMKTIAYWSGADGLEIKSISEDTVYFVTGAWVGKPVPHHAKIYTDSKDGIFFRVHGYKVPLKDCIRV